MKEMRIIITGGGTGGHIFPAVAIGHALRRMYPGVQILFVGAKGKMEMQRVPAAGFDIVGLDIAGLNRSSWIKNLSLPFKLLKSLWQARKILRDFRPHAVVGVGGYASFPMLKAAQQKGIATVIQEQNSFAGKSNRVLARQARAVCVAYDGMEQFFPPSKIVKTGNPVRREIAASQLSRAEGIRWAGLQEEGRVLLVVGGSLGAVSVNEAVAAALPKMMEAGLQLIWQTGESYYEKAKEIAEPFAGKIKVFKFIGEMDQAYAAADIVLSRAGALAVSELCIVAKPVIFVPYPYAAEDHQTSNALALVTHNAAVMIRDADVRQELFISLESLLKDKSVSGLMQANLSRFAVRDADERIVNEIVKAINL